MVGLTVAVSTGTTTSFARVHNPQRSRLDEGLPNSSSIARSIAVRSEDVSRIAQCCCGISQVSEQRRCSNIRPILQPCPSRSWSQTDLRARLRAARCLLLGLSSPNARGAAAPEAVTHIRCYLQSFTPWWVVYLSWRRQDCHSSPHKRVGVDHEPEHCRPARG